MRRSLRKSTFNVSEFAETTRTNRKISSKPLASLIPSQKSARLYAELAELFGRGNADSAGAFVEYSDTLKKMLSDNASLCHEAALEAAIAFANGAKPELVSSVSSSSINIVVEKHAPTPKLQPKAFDALFAFAQNGSAEQVHSALISGSAHKVPKVRAAAAKALAAVVAKLGGKSLDLKAVGGVMLGLIEHRDKAVRDEGLTLLGELRLARGDAASSTRSSRCQRTSR